ncbi:MAG: hypothetical protein Q9183_001443 [Haloplaca sp. 2 TL-2023]
MALTVARHRFLLKYETRDEVKILKRGGGGVVDVRETIAQYDEQSPLYGFVHYRRRKVILKYVPEGTSRLLQARVSVHFQAVTERFTPHDTVFSFTTPKGLNDVALSSACSLHTASASIKSSSDSLRQRGLSGIAEDVSEFPSYQADVEPMDEKKDDSNGPSPPSVRPERTDSLSNAQIPVALPMPERRESTSQSPKRKDINKALPPTPSDKAEDRATTRNALEDSFLESRPSIEGRPSVQSNRPSMLSMRTSYEHRPKVKLGPRPSLDSPGRVKSSDPANDFRPVSALPNGVRSSSKKQAPTRPKSASGQRTIVEMPEHPLPSPKLLSPAVVSEKNPSPAPNTLARQLHGTDSKPVAMTPEKRRLKKALELRKKQLAARNALETPEQEAQPDNTTSHESPDCNKRESLTSTLPDVSPADDSNADVLQARIDALHEEPDLVHVGPQNLSKETPEVFDVSPVTIAEVSDGPSTQASSISGEDEISTKVVSEQRHQVQDNHSAAVSTVPEPSVLDHVSSPMLESPQPSGQCIAIDSSGIIEHEAQQPAIEAPIADHPATTGEEPAPLDLAESPSKPIQEKLVSEEASRDPSPVSEVTSPLYKRRSVSVKSISIDAEILKPHDIPLPPIDEDEEASLTPQGKVFDKNLMSIPSITYEDGQHRSLSPSQEDNDSLVEVRPASTDAFSEQRDRRARRHGLINPVKRVSSPDGSEEQFLSDDSFMEELKSATVQEAKPMSVSKSPIMPVFPRSVPESKSTENLRPTSASSRLNRPKRQDDHPMMPKLPDLFSARSSSAPYAPLTEAQLSPPTLKKMGVSSGISQRIKALEQLSSRPGSPSSQNSSPAAASAPSYNFPKPRKTSFRTSQAAAEIAKASTQASTARSYAHFSPSARTPEESSKQLGDGAVRVDRIDVTTKSGKVRPESISVTARIVRGGSQNKVSQIPEDGSRAAAPDLYPSPLTVEHQSKRPATPLSPLKPPKPLYARSSSSSSTAHKSDPLPAPRRDSISSRLSSTPSRRGSEPELPHSMSDSSINSMINYDGSKEDKKESRKSRLFKRMSNISAASRRSIASALSPVRKDIKDEPIVEHQEPSRESIRPLAVDVGDVNVQFPDTLLWKRRHMQIDEKGLLVLSASKADNNAKVITKRYPFTEFNPPYLPDQDQEELPNSVVLDFRDGSTLQCACENSYARKDVLRALKQAHQTYNR